MERKGQTWVAYVPRADAGIAELRPAAVVGVARRSHTGKLDDPAESPRRH